MPLMRPRQGRWLTGVCKGIALHLGIGVAWVRIAFIALTVLYGAGIIAYVFLWVFMPAGDPWRLRLAQCPLIRRRLREAISHLPLMTTNRLPHRNHCPRPSNVLRNRPSWHWPVSR